MRSLITLLPARAVAPQALIPALLLSLTFLTFGWYSNYGLSGDLRLVHVFGTDVESESKGSEVLCDPFRLPGQLEANYTTDEEAHKITYRPFDSTCPPFRMMGRLRDSIKSGELDPVLDDFLRGKSVAIFGDSVDRDHLTHFCFTMGLQPEWVFWDHWASPPAVGRIIPEYLRAAKTLEERLRFSLARPRVCRVELYNFTLFSGFHFGLFTKDNIFRDMAHFYLPETLEERLEHILLPIIKSFGYPTGPSLIEIQSSFWDTMRFAHEDGWRGPQLSDPTIGFGDLSAERLEWWMGRVEQVIRFTAAHVQPPFDRGTKSVYPVPILWRLPHLPRFTNSVGHNRIDTMRKAAAYVVDRIRTKSGGNVGVSRVRKASFWINEQVRLASKAGRGEVGLAERLRTNEWGTIMVGQQHRLHDSIHPSQLPGSWLWADIILFELHKAHLQMAERSKR